MDSLRRLLKCRLGSGSMPRGYSPPTSFGQFASLRLR
jgi:hypothetical protein